MKKTNYEPNKEFIKNLDLYANTFILKVNEERGKVRDIVVAGDREGSDEGGKTTAGLKICYERYLKHNEKFVFILRYDNMIHSMGQVFKEFGFAFSNGEVRNPNKNKEIVGFIIAINTWEKTKIKYMRKNNITTCIFEELVPEIGKVPANIADQISSTVSSIFGKRKLAKWKELNIQNYFFTNNKNNQHPIFYAYGLSEKEIGISYKYIKDFKGLAALISLVDKNNNQVIDPLLNLGGYGKTAYGRTITLQNDIITAVDFNFEGWKWLFNIQLYDILGGIYVKDDEYLLHEKVNEEDENYYVIGTSSHLENVHYDLLTNLYNASLENKLYFSDWKLKQELMKSLEKNANKI